MLRHCGNIWQRTHANRILARLLLRKSVMKRLYILLLIIALCASTHAREFVTGIQGKNIRTLRLSQDLLTLQSAQDGSETIEVSFDELSHEVKMYSYTVRHLRSNWEEDDLQTTDYLRGFTTADINNYEHSFNTQQLYTHYSFQFPNEDMQPLVSGNYVIIIYEDGQMERPVATACFSIVEPMASIACNIRSNTDIEFSGRYQQLDIEAKTDGVRSVSPDEFTLVVEQNGRRDNRALGIRPTYVQNNRLQWQNSRALIFEGGQEYQHFDISSVYYKGNNVDQIHFDHTFYHAFLFPSEIRANGPYLTEPDANGSFVINAERTDYDDTEADYMFVHFVLPAEQPWFDGQIYLLGGAWNNQFTPDNRLTYDNEHRCYTLSCYLKQGGYEWLYAFVPKGSTTATLQRVEGSHWQTNNRYRIYLYHHAIGTRYDALIGVIEQKN